MATINSDFAQKVILHSDDLEWKPSPLPGVDRRMLDRVGDEVARATSIVRYAPGSSFSRHTHTGGEEYIVLDGVFQDDYGDHPAGEYVRNPPTSAHTPFTNPGCTIFVKLWQMDPDDRTQVNTDMTSLSYDTTAASLQQSSGGKRSLLFRNVEETVYLQQLGADEQLQVDAAGGAEVLVLAGTLRDADGDQILRAHSWMRVPVGSRVRGAAGGEGAKVWVKTGHLHMPRGVHLGSK